MTPAQAKKARADLWREIAREERRAAREKLAALRAELSMAWQDAAAVDSPA